MFAGVTALRYWKSERTDLATCEDALRGDARRGLFCVADGAGTTLFSRIWAEILVQHFLDVPLVSGDPAEWSWELEWWIRQAQPRYREQTPPPAQLDWSVRQKAVEQGAYATLATLRFSRADEETATAELLAIGDSCIIIAHEQQKTITPFPLQHAADFERAPYCVPALLKNLNRKTLYPRQQQVTLQPGDCVILATDAVAHWIIAGGATGREEHAWDAFQEIAAIKNDDDWHVFVKDQRANCSLVDDDSTALIIRLRSTGEENERLGYGAEPAQEIVEQRKKEFEQARSIDNKELVALLYGDGRLLSAAGITLSDDEKKHARAVAEAMAEVLQGMREALKSASFAAKMEPLWRQHAPLLLHEPCAETIRKNLAAQGVRLEAPPTASQAERVIEPSIGLPWRPGTSSGAVQGSSDIPIQPLKGSDPELAVSLPRPPVSSPPPSQETPALHAFRAALTTRDEVAIVKAFDPAFEHELSREEHQELEMARARLKSNLIDRLRTTIDQDDDDAVLAVAQAIDASPMPIIPTEFEKTRIRQAAERKEAIKLLRRKLAEGTAGEKVAALSRLSPDRLTLNDDDRQQLEIAQQLVDALTANDDARICAAYDRLENSPFYKDFTLPIEDRQRLQEARKAGYAAQLLHDNLRIDQANITLIVDIYRRNQALRYFLTEDELRILEIARDFLDSTQDPEQTIQVQKNRRVQLYDQLFFSPYRFVFSTDETQQIENERAVAHIARPPIAQVNQKIIDITQFLALYNIKPSYAEQQIQIYQQRHARERDEVRRQSYQKSIVSWRGQIGPQHLAWGVLDDLIEQVLIEQAIETEKERLPRSFEKDVRKMQEDFLKNIRPFLEKNREFPPILLSEQQLYDALRPYALSSLFTNYLRKVAGERLERVADWRSELRQKAQITYYLFPRKDAPTVPDRQDGWLFRWWFLRGLSTTKRQGETGYA